MPSLVVHLPPNPGSRLVHVVGLAGSPLPALEVEPDTLQRKGSSHGVWFVTGFNTRPAFRKSGWNSRLFKSWTRGLTEPETGSLDIAARGISFRGRGVEHLDEVGVLSSFGCGWTHDRSRPGNQLHQRTGRSCEADVTMRDGLPS